MLCRPRTSRHNARRPTSCMDRYHPWPMGARIAICPRGLRPLSDHPDRLGNRRRSPSYLSRPATRRESPAPSPPPRSHHFRYHHDREPILLRERRERYPRHLTRRLRTRVHSNPRRDDQPDDQRTARLRYLTYANPTSRAYLPDYDDLNALSSIHKRTVLSVTEANTLRYDATNDSEPIIHVVR